MDIKLGPIRLYSSHIRDYMRRWILDTPFGMIRIHNILKSDDDRHLHDHPFDFTSIILKGGYWEETPTNLFRVGRELPIPMRMKAFYPQFSVIKRDAKDLHKLTLLDNEPVWTLVFSSVKKRVWGFMTEEGWVPNTEYMYKYQGLSNASESD